MKEKLIIVDYNMGNINSIKNMLRYLGYSAKLSSDKIEILQAEKLILPGVGNYKAAIEQIDKLDLRSVLNEAVLERKKPILGICLGMQLLLSHSEEGDCDGLGWIKGSVKKFNLDTAKFKIPHMGWDFITIQRNNALCDKPQEDLRFYFVHSYYAKCDERPDCIATTDYGIIFDSVIGHENIFGVQFHPEKSHKYGMKIFENFLKF